MLLEEENLGDLAYLGSLATMLFSVCSETEEVHATAYIRSLQSEIGGLGQLRKGAF